MGSTPILSAMKRYSDSIIDQIRTERKEHKYSFYHLSRLHGIPSSTIRNWCYGTVVYSKSDILSSFHERKRAELKLTEISAIDDAKEITTERAKLYAALIYWCEGAKYPASNKMALTNSDPDLIHTFIRLLRKGFSLDNRKFRIHLQIHTDQDYEQLKSFWSITLSIPPEQFIKPTITAPNGKKHRVRYQGTCTVRYQDYRLQLKLIGLYEDFVRKTELSLK